MNDLARTYFDRYVDNTGLGSEDRHVHRDVKYSLVNLLEKAFEAGMEAVTEHPDSFDLLTMY